MDQTAPKVSIILATNRSGLFLEAALASIAAQTFTDYELTVVDDGSEDPSEVDRVCAVFFGCRVIHQRAAGVSIARNTGASASRGNLLAFLDDDDIWHPERLRLHVAAHEGDPGAVLSYCSWRAVDTATGAVVSVHREGSAVSVGGITAGSPRLFTPNYMVLRAAFVAVGGFNPSLRIAEDLDLALRLLPRGRLLFVDEILVDHRRHDANATHSYQQTVLYTRVLLEFHRGVARIEGQKQHARAIQAAQIKNDRLAWTGAEHAFNAREPKRFVHETWWALIHAPRGLASWFYRRLRRAD